MSKANVAAHRQTWTNRVTVSLMIPEHEPRGHDKFANVFRAAKKKMHELDVPCWRCGVRLSDIKRDGPGVVTDANPHGATQMEAHHNEVEFSLAAGVDLFKIEHDHPEFKIDNEFSFLRWLESEGNLLALCDKCHRSPTQGIHGALSYPLWKMERVWRKDVAPLIGPAEL